MALPAGSSPDLGPRHFLRAAFDRRGDRRPAEKTGGAADQTVLPLRFRSNHRTAGLADAGNSRPANRSAGGEELADAADSEQAAVVLANARDHGRPHRLHAGAA